MTSSFDTMINRRSTECVKWNKFEDDVLPMWVADMDFQAPEPVLHALKERVEHGIFGYPCPSEEAKGALIGWLDKRHGWSVQPEDVILLPGVVTGFNLATHAVTRPGEGILVQTPAYRPFLDVPDNVKRELHLNPLVPNSSGYYEVPEQHFRDSIQENTRIFMLCNPQNPTGRVFRKEELEFMAEVCLENEIIICSDEIHSDLVYPPHEHIPIASLGPEIAAQTITLLAPSKTFNIAGLKASAAVIPNPDLRESFLNARQGLVGWVNLFGLLAFQTAYEAGEAWLEDLLVYLQANRNALVDLINQNVPGVQAAPPEGTFLAWLDCRETGLEDPQEFFLEQGRVGFNDGLWFGANGKGHVRLNFGCPKDTLLEGLTRLKTALETLPD